jgi:PQQ-like domain
VHQQRPLADLWRVIGVEVASASAAKAATCTTVAAAAMFRGGPARSGNYSTHPATPRPAAWRPWTHPTAGEIGASAVVAGRVVYIDSFEGRLHALDADSDQRRWTYPAGGTSRMSPLRKGVTGA